MLHTDDKSWHEYFYIFLPIMWKYDIVKGINFSYQILAFWKAWYVCYICTIIPNLIQSLFSKTVIIFQIMKCPLSVLLYLVVRDWLEGQILTSYLKSGELDALGKYKSEFQRFSWIFEVFIFQSVKTKMDAPTNIKKAKHFSHFGV